MAVRFLRGVYSSVYIDMLSFEKSDGRRTSLMLTVDTLIAVLSLCLTSFGLGYAIGSNGSKNTKNPHQPENSMSLS